MEEEEGFTIYDAHVGNGDAQFYGFPVRGEPRAAACDRTWKRASAVHGLVVDG